MTESEIRTEAEVRCVEGIILRYAMGPTAHPETPARAACPAGRIEGDNAD